MIIAKLFPALVHAKIIVKVKNIFNEANLELPINYTLYVKVLKVVFDQL